MSPSRPEEPSQRLISFTSPESRVIPVHTGDTVRVRARVLEKSVKDEAGGMVIFEKTVLNQLDQNVIAYVDKMSFRSRP